MGRDGGFCQRRCSQWTAPGIGVGALIRARIRHAPSSLTGRAAIPRRPRPRSAGEKGTVCGCQPRRDTAARWTRGGGALVVPPLRPVHERSPPDSCDAGDIGSRSPSSGRLLRGRLASTRRGPSRRATSCWRSRYVRPECGAATVATVAARARPPPRRARRVAAGRHGAPRSLFHALQVVVEREVGEDETPAARLARSTTFWERRPPARRVKHPGSPPVDRRCP